MRYPAGLGLFKNTMTYNARYETHRGLIILASLLGCCERYVANEVGCRVEMASKIHVVPTYQNENESESNFHLPSTYQ